MKMMLATVLTLGLLGTAMADTYQIDANHVFPTFEIKHLGLATFRGRFDKTSGTITLDKAKKQGTANVTIDVKSVSTGVAKLNEHLLGPDFFDARKFPTITFKSRDFRFTGDELKSVVGDLAIHGVTKPVTLKVDSFVCKDHPMTKKEVCGADLSTTIKRADFGVNYAPPSLGADVAIRIGVEAHKK